MVRNLWLKKKRNTIIRPKNGIFVCPNIEISSSISAPCHLLLILIDKSFMVKVQLIEAFNTESDIM